MAAHSAQFHTPLLFVCISYVCRHMQRVCPVGEKQPLRVEKEGVLVVRDWGFNKTSVSVNLRN